MNERIRKLAEQAGFQFWEDEPWNPGDIIDWSCRYDDEFKKFVELLIIECGQAVDAGLAQDEIGAYPSEYIKHHFGVK